VLGHQGDAVDLWARRIGVLTLIMVGVLGIAAVVGAIAGLIVFGLTVLLERLT
jgi:hypothetical protein